MITFSKEVFLLHNVNDQGLCTRTVKVGPFIRLIYWGLDDHIDHHVYPKVPSMNLPKLHKLINQQLPEPLGVIDCWREIYAIAKEKDQRPKNEFVPCELKKLNEPETEEAFYNEGA